MGSGVGALFRARRWLPLAVSSGWVGRNITSSYEDANPVPGTPPTLTTLSPPKVPASSFQPLGAGLQHEFGGWGPKHLVHSRSLGMRGQDLPPGPKREPGRKVIPPLGRQCWGGQWAAVCPHSSLFPGARAGAGAAAGCGMSLRQGQRCGKLQGTAPPRGDEHVPSAQGGGCAGGHSPQRRRLAPCRLSWATGWRGGAPGGGESKAPPGPGVILLHITPWAHIPGTFEPSSSSPQGPAFSDSQGQWGRECPERTDLALSAPSKVDI